LGDGTYRFFCVGRHTKDEIDEAISESVPAFTTGSILKKRQSLI
jgi:predicted secreted Zn-dependent protease